MAAVPSESESDYNIPRSKSDRMMEIDLEEHESMEVEESSESTENSHQNVSLKVRSQFSLDATKAPSEIDYGRSVHANTSSEPFDNCMEIDAPIIGQVEYGKNSDVMKLLCTNTDYCKGVICSEESLHIADGRYEKGEQYEIDPQEFYAVNGEVALCTDRTTRTPFILKKVNRKHFRRNEVEVPLRLSGVYKMGFPKIHGVIFQDEKIEIYQEFVGKSLYSWLEDPVVANYIKQPDIVFQLMRQMFTILQRMHSHGIVHRDIKLENICMTNAARLTLIDYGSCEKLGDPIRTDGWTHEYLSPECTKCILKGTFIQRKESDVWAAGVTIVNFLHCKNIFLIKFAGMSFYNHKDPDFYPKLNNCLLNISQLTDEVVKEEFFNPAWKEEIWSVLRNILRVDPKERWSADEALKQLKFISSFLPSPSIS